MNLLLDTQALLWFLLDDSRLSSAARALITATENGLLVSPASFWEIAIKISLNKYILNEDFEGFMERQVELNQLTILPISIKHASTVAKLPFHHRDPFDRLLIAQAICEQVPIISVDSAFDAYPVARMW